MNKNNLVTSSLSQWIGLIENLNIKRRVLEKELSYNTKNYATLSIDDKRESDEGFHEIQNIDQFINIVEKSLKKNSTYNMLCVILEEMANAEIKGIDNKSDFMFKESKVIAEYYKEEFTIKLDKPINEYIGY